MKDIVQGVAEDLARALNSGEATQEELLQMASDSLIARHPEAATPERLDAFSVLCGACVGRALQMTGS